MVTPDHVLQAVHSNPLFDFLTTNGLYCGQNEAVCQPGDVSSFLDLGPDEPK